MTNFLTFENVGKKYGNVVALKNVSMEVSSGKVLCILGDNGAGKSTLIKIISGLHKYDSGRVSLDGKVCKFGSPKEALVQGIATVYQDLAVVSLMSVWRNFFLGSELCKKIGFFKKLDIKSMQEITLKSLVDLGIDLLDVDQPIGQLSGGQRQCVAIARAIYFGAKILVLDEPTAALGVKQSGVVLRHILQAKALGLAVVFITHNPHHAFPVGDNFLVLQRGESVGYFAKDSTTLEDLTQLMSGGADLEDLRHELEQFRGGV